MNIKNIEWLSSEFEIFDNIFSDKMKMLKFQDEELSHINADELLLEILTTFKMNKTVTEFRNLDKWYT
jgi:hypothetical protein